jgi:hypothetical protein
MCVVTLASTEPGHMVGFCVSPQRFRTERKDNYEVRLTATAAGTHANPGSDHRVRAEDTGDFRVAADRAAVHAKKLHAEMLRIIARISSGA